MAQEPNTVRRCTTQARLWVQHAAAKNPGGGMHVAHNAGPLAPPTAQGLLDLLAMASWPRSNIFCRFFDNQVNF